MRAREMEAKYFNWCINNGLKIYPVPSGTTGYNLVVDKLKKRKWTPNVGKKIYARNPKYNEPKWWIEIDKLYKHYYKMGTDPNYKEQFRKQTKELKSNK